MHSETASNNKNANSSSQAWWESLAKARKAIDALAPLVGLSQTHLELFQHSETPARALMDSPEVSNLLLESLSKASAGTASDPLCQWLFDTFHSNDPYLQLFVIRFLPLLAGIYLCRTVSEKQPLPGFEAVLLAVYSSEARSRSGRPLLVDIPDLRQPSLYHTPREPGLDSRVSVGQLCGPLEPQSTVKSTKRAQIVGVGLDLFYRKIAVMPAEAKIEFCRYVQAWAGQFCSCMFLIDSGTDCNGNSDKALANELGNLGIRDSSSTSSSGSSSGESDSANGVIGWAFDGQKYEFRAPPYGTRIALQWELIQPILKVLGHCVLGPLNGKDVRDAASMAVRSLFARASHNLDPQTILATRSLIRLDIAARQSAAASELKSSTSNSTETRKQRKPEVFLVSK